MSFSTIAVAKPRDASSEVAEKFSWREVGRGVFNLQTWLTACAYFGILSGLYSFGLFVRSTSLLLTCLEFA
jgi:hypothetical protein